MEGVEVRGETKRDILLSHPSLRGNVQHISTLFHHSTPLYLGHPAGVQSLWQILSHPVSEYFIQNVITTKG